MKLSFSYPAACVVVWAFLFALPESCRSAEHGTSDSERVRHLISQLGSEQFEVRERAAKELIKFGSAALKPLRDAVASADPEIVRRAKDCIVIIERDLRIVSHIVALKDKRPDIRKEAALRLFDLGPIAKAAVPALLDVLEKDNEPRVRNAATAALTEMGPDAKMAVPQLIELLRDKNVPPDIRWNAVTILGAIGPSAGEAVPILLHVLQTEDDDVKRAAALALGKIGGKQKEIVPALITQLAASDTFVQRNSASALGMLAREPARTIPALVAVVKRHDRGKDTLHPCCAAIWALGRFGRKAKDAVPLLAAILRDKDEDRTLRTTAIGTLMEIGTEAKDAIAALEAIRSELGFGELAAEALEVIVKANK